MTLAQEQYKQQIEKIEDPDPAIGQCTIEFDCVLNYHAHFIIIAF